QFPQDCPEHSDSGHDPAVDRRGSSAAASSEASLSVLVVEDEESIRDLLEEVFESAGCRVDAVADGERALARFQNGHYSIVMTDIALPGLDGVSLVRRMRASDPKAVLVVLTGRASDDTVEQAREAGASVVLSKPFELSDVIGIIKNVRE